MRGSSDQAFIIVRAPNGDVREFPIGELAVVIGRDESADIRVEDRKVSRRHAAFKLIDGQPWIEDLGSINGVKLNGKKVSERALILPGDVVSVGGYEVTLKSPVKAQRRRPSSEPPMERTPILDLPANRPRRSDPMVRSERRSDPAVRSDTATARLVLIGQSKPVLGKRFTLGFGENIIGRLEECAVPILDGSVSRQHAKIVLTLERATLIDLASSNGVFINDVRVDSADLTGGDRLRVGNVGFEVELASEIPSRVGPVEPSRYQAPAVAAKRGRGKILLLASAGVLLIAAGIFLAATRYSQRVKGWMARAPVAQSDAGAAPLVPPDSGAPALAVAPRPDSGQAAAAPEAPVDAGAVARAEIPDAAAAARPAPAAALARTATSPYGKRDAEGRPVDVPPVDESFDFDAFVRAKLEEAIAAETSGRFQDVRRVIAELIARDPINQDAQQIRKRVELAERSKQALAQGDELRSQGKLLRAIDVYSTIAKDAPGAKDAQERITALKPLAVKRELGLIERELKKKKTWPMAHRRLSRVLELDPDNMIAKAAIVALEAKLRDANIDYEPSGRPGAAPAGGESTPSQRDDIARRWEDRGLARVAQVYADGDLAGALRRVEAVGKRVKGAKKQQARALASSLRKLSSKYERVRTEVPNDPSQAWAHLMEFQKLEQDVLPESVKSYLARELEETIAEAFAERGTAYFEQERFELAFQQWDAGYKLNPANATITAGLKKLENKALKWAEEAELAAQRGQPDACDRWRRITRMTKGDSEAHKKARERLQRGCSS